MSLMNKRGFTLIELMISLLINAMLFVGLVDIFVTNLTHYRKVLNNNQLREQLQNAVDLMSAEIRRAGYWVNASNDLGLNTNTNPFMVSGSTDITVNVGNNCIIFTYDKNANGTLPSISSSYDDERYGFRLNNNTLQTRPPGATFSCTATNWENMTDPTVITITAFTVTLNTTTVSTGGTSSLAIRTVDITLSGRLTNDTSVTRTITQHVRVRNDKYIP